ncbi:MAG TPA: NlpC/P60 family protein [Jatrophihabitans sp.]|nr:NlpC/P60 family protein [Jatrophihabitans sp.]
MAATGTVSARTAACLGAAVAAVLGLATWVGVAAVGAVDRGAERPPMEMVRAVSATYQPTAAPTTQRAAPARIGDWTPQRGNRIARRALHWLNWPYSFGAGGPSGPSYGHAVDSDSRNDDKVFGFDCSGLTMYAVAPWRSLDHYAAAQYTQVGSFHPTIDTLQPGDFVFWSKDGTIGGIGHVAVYIGSGLVVQAPHSGDVIRETPIYQVEPGTMGATRPLT